MIKKSIVQLIISLIIKLPSLSLLSDDPSLPSLLLRCICDLGLKMLNGLVLSVFGLILTGCGSIGLDKKF